MADTSKSVIAYHLIMTFYGFWLPNDPRGSGSKEVWSDALKPFGPATYTDSHQSVVRVPHNWRVRKLAKSALKHPCVVISGIQARSIGAGFRHCLGKLEIECYACAIMPEHVHLVLGRIEKSIEDIAINLKASAAHELLAIGMHPFQQHRIDGLKVPKMWARGQRKRFLFDAEGVYRSIRYVEDNPTFGGLPRQTWGFVKAYE